MPCSLFFSSIKFTLFRFIVRLLIVTITFNCFRDLIRLRISIGFDLPVASFFLPYTVSLSQISRRARPTRCSTRLKPFKNPLIASKLLLIRRKAALPRSAPLFHYAEYTHTHFGLIDIHTLFSTFSSSSALSTLLGFATFMTSSLSLHPCNNIQSDYYLD